MAGESCDDSCTGLSHTGRKVWSSFAILELIGYFYCVTVIKHSMSLKRMESYIRTSRWERWGKSNAISNKGLYWVLKAKWIKGTHVQIKKLLCSAWRNHVDEVIKVSHSQSCE